MSYQPCFAAPSDLASGKREQLMPELLAAFRQVCYGSIALMSHEERDSSRFKQTSKIQRRAQKQNPRVCLLRWSGEVLARPGRLTKLPEVATKKHREFR
jgi:hypothetical protein